MESSSLLRQMAFNTSLYCPELQFLQSLISEGYSKDSTRSKEELASTVTTNEGNWRDFKVQEENCPPSRASDALLRADEEL